MDEARLKEIEAAFLYACKREPGESRTEADERLVGWGLQYGDDLFAALREAWRERDGGLVGTSNCPICGKSTPHHHSAEPAERGDLLPTIKHALNELQMSGESSHLASNEIYPYAIGWLWYLVKRAARAEAEVERLKEKLQKAYAGVDIMDVLKKNDAYISSLETVREAAEEYMQAKGRNCAADFSDMKKQDMSYQAYLKAEANLRRALDSLKDPAR